MEPDFEEEIEVWRPADHGREKGRFYDIGRQAEPAMAVVEPMTAGALQRQLGTDGLWTGGAISLFTSFSLSPADDDTQVPADWVYWRGKFYEIAQSLPWDDEELEHWESVAILSRPQPQIDP